MSMIVPSSSFDVSTGLIGEAAVLVPQSRSDCRLRLVMFRDTAQLADLPLHDQWNSLCTDQPFLSWEWMHHWFQKFGQPNQARILVVVDQDDCCVGVLPMYLRCSHKAGRVLAMMADGRACSDHMRPTCDDRRAAECLELFAQWIVLATQRERLDAVEFDGVDRDDPWMQMLVQRLVAAGMWRTSQNIESTWRAKLTGDWKSFEAGLTKSFRRKTKKAFANRAKPELRIDVATDALGIAAAWPAVVQLHTRRRQKVGDPGCFADPRFSEFLRDALIALAHRGAAEVIVASENDRPFGCVCLLVGASEVGMYQSGFDPDQSRWEPGHLLSTFAVERAIEMRKATFDFLRGDEPYKARWQTQAVAMERITLIPPRIKARLRHKCLCAARLVKRLLLPSRSNQMVQQESE